jgi:transposase
MNRKPYPSDVSEEELVLGAPYLTLMTPEAPQRTPDLREVFNAVRWLVRTGAHGRMMPQDRPPWPAVYQQLRRWLDAGVCADLVAALRVGLRVAAGRAPEPRAALFDPRRPTEDLRCLILRP